MSPMSAEEITLLVKKAQKGDKTSFSKIYDLYSKKILKFLSYKVSSQSIAEDLSSEVWVQVIKSLKSFSFKSQFNTWIFGIAKNILYQHYKEKSANLETASLESYMEKDDTKFFGEEEDFDPVDDSVEEKKYENYLDKVLGSLNAIQRAVLELRFLKGYKVNEVAEELGMTESNVKVTQMRAIKKIKNSESYLKPE